MSPVLKNRKKQKHYVKNYFDEYSSQYHQDHYVKKKPPSIYPVLTVRLNYMAAMLADFTPGGKVIDIGCGTGEMLEVLRAHQLQAFGLDFSFKMLEAIANSSLEYSFPLINGEIEALPFHEESFDGVICAGVIEYLNEDQKALKEIARILKPGGFAIITLSNRLSPARILEPVVHSLLGQKIKRWIKKVLFKKQTMLYPPFRTHIPGRFDKKAQDAGLKLVEHNFFHFSPVPWPLNRLVPRFYVRTGLKMEKLSRSKLGFLGRGYIGKYQKL